MKKSLLLSLFFLPFILVNAQKAYVNQNASGNGDGSSWANAYTTLEAGLKDANAMELWIAAGTYLPTNSDSGYFHLNRNMHLYGGFAGTESTLEERDIEVNKTILSGDLNGDDLIDDLSANREDNSMHVLFVRDADKTMPIIIDGFEIRGGHTSNDPNVDRILRSGGGILSDNPLAVRNCNFINNFGRSGAALLILDTILTAPSEISNCTFEKNLGSTQGVAFVVLDSILVKNSKFINNESSRGAFYPLFTRSVNIDGSEFTGNRNIDNVDLNPPGLNQNGFGGGIFAIGVQFFNIQNTKFDNNFATYQGGGIYNDQDDFLPLGNSSFKLTNCEFTNNASSDTAGVGGAVRLWQNINVEVRNTSFIDNSSRGSGIFNCSQGQSAEIEVKGITLFDNCIFEGNALVDTAGFGGAINLWQNKEVQIYNTKFIQNRSFSAGAIYADARNISADETAKNTMLIQDCSFEENTSQGFAGAITFWQGTGIRLVRDTFINNQGSSAGAVNYNGSATFPR
ncbi:MAG: hypothetical protein AAGK97_01565, partial [Bacteroidota bacterium]